MGGGRQEIRFCASADGVRLAYAVSGRGPPLVKAANWLSHLEFDWNSPVWRHLLDELSARHTLLRYDERGCGLSDWDVADMSFDAWLADLEAVVDASGFDRFPLLGFSQGVSVAIAYAARHPERVTRLVLHSGYARGRLMRGATARDRDEADALAKLASLGWGKEDPAFRQFFTTQFIPDGTPEQHRWFNELERISTSPENAARFFRVMNDIDVVALAPRVSCPALILHMRGDSRVPFAEGRLLASLVPGARFISLESRNHIPLEQEPAWIRWREEVRSFLDEDHAGGGAFPRLTPKERELVELLARGLDNAQIAAHLDLSEKTVRNRVSAIFGKLEVESRSQAIVRARESGFGLKGR